MNNGKHQVMACGACSIVVDEDGRMTTSIDKLVAGIKRLVSRTPRQQRLCSL